jgi:predicted secreted protein
MGLRKFKLDRCPEYCYRGFVDEEITRDICDKCKYRKFRVDWVVTDPVWPPPTIGEKILHYVAVLIKFILIGLILAALAAGGVWVWNTGLLQGIFGG